MKYLPFFLLIVNLNVFNALPSKASTDSEEALLSPPIPVESYRRQVSDAPDPEVAIIDHRLKARGLTPERRIPKEKNAFNSISPKSIRDLGENHTGKWTRWDSPKKGKIWRRTRNRWDRLVPRERNKRSSVPPLDLNKRQRVTRK